MAAFRVVNETPLTLSIQGIGGIETVEPLGSVEISGGQGERWSIVDETSKAILRTFVLGGSGDVCVVGERDIVSGRTPGQAVDTAYCNRTSCLVDLYRIAADGREERFATLDPGDDVGLSMPWGQAVVARELVTQDLLAAEFVSSWGGLEIDDAFRRARRRQLAPKPESRHGIGELRLVDSPKRTEGPQSRLYIRKSVHKCPVEPLFNTRPQVSPKRVRVSGATLIWDEDDDDYGLIALSGQLDMRALEVFADTVIIRSKLWFPRTDVTIHARELVFERGGCVDTSPKAFDTVARSPYRSKEGDIPTNRKGDLYHPADGVHGEKAGDVRLFVRRLRQDKVSFEPRFRCRGSDGQTAEPGDLKRYTAPAGKPEYPRTSATSVAPVTVKNVTDYLGQLIANKPEHWRWPGEVDSPEKIKMENDALNKGKIVHLRLFALDTNAAVTNASLGFLPSGKYQLLVGPWVSSQQQDPERRRPSDGCSAYPPGQPGDGGKGGSLTFCMPAGEPTPVLNFDLQGGRSIESEAVPGEAAGGPSPAYWADMFIVKRTPPFESELKPKLDLNPVSANAGAKGGARQGKHGIEGKFETKADTGLMWANPALPIGLEAYVACARDAFRNGHRENARDLLEPYHAIFVEEQRAGRSIPAALNGLFAEILSMRQNLVSNLDYYGHPVGWLPRLNVTTCYNLWQSERNCASQILYFAETLETEWNEIQDRGKFLRETAKALKSETDAAVARLPKAYDDLAEAKKALHELSNETVAIKEKVERLRRRVAEKAKDDIAVQQAFSGFCKIAGGLLEIIPVGQPYLGLAGKTFGVVGDFDWNQPDPMKGVGDGLAELGGVVDTFLGDNQDLIVRRSSRRLEEKVRVANTALESLERSVEDAQKRLEEPVRESEQQRLQARIDRIDLEIESLSGKEKDKQEDTKKALEETLHALKVERLAALRGRLEEELVDLTGSEDDEEAEAKRALLASIAELEEKKRGVATTVDDCTTKLEKREKATDDLLTSLKNAGSGLSMIGDGIARLSAPYDEAQVDRMVAEILKKSGEFHDEYVALIKDLKAASQRRARAAAALGICSQRFSGLTALISKNLGARIALSDQLQAVDDILDAGVQHYLQEMQKHARERLLWYQYNFVKAYQYEFLRDVGDDFLNLDNWVERLRQAKRKIRKLKDDDAVVLDEGEFREVEEVVALAQLRELAKTVVEERHRFARKTLPFDLKLKPAMLDELHRAGKVSFTLPELGIGTYYDHHAKVVSLQLEQFDINPNDNDLTFELEFRHGGESIVRGHDGVCYYFQCAKGEAPITWNFSYNGGKEERIAAATDENDDNSDPMFDDMAIEYREYYPSAFGEITLWINPSQHQTPAKLRELLDRIESINVVRAKVRIVKAALPMRNKGTRAQARRVAAANG